MAVRFVFSCFLLVAVQKFSRGHRSQFMVSHDDGSYGFGYDTGEGVGAEQFSDSSNQVFGRYFYKNELGQTVEVSYSAGVQGFVPLGFKVLDEEPSNSRTTEVVPEIETTTSLPQDLIENVTTTEAAETTESARSENVTTNEASAQTTESARSSRDFLNPDGSYAFSYATDDSFRQETADAKNHVQGSFVYKDGTVNHDLSYAAGADTGFVVTGGSLAVPNGLRHIQADSAIFYSLPRTSDGSYSFEYSTPTQSRHEISDAKGNVYGGYSFVNEEGHHDLRYVAGSTTGFLPVGGSLLKSFEGQGSNSVSDDSTTTNDESVIVENSSDAKSSKTEESSGFISKGRNAGVHGYIYSVV